MVAPRSCPPAARRRRQARAPLAALAVAPALAPALALVVVLAPGNASAFDAEVSATTVAQGYSLRSPFGDPVLYRRRFLQTLALSGSEAVGDEKPGGPRLSLRLKMRFDGDFAVDGSETGFDRTDPASRYVPGLREGPVDLMYGYLEGSRFFGGHVGFRLGRQYAIDTLGFWSFDGGWVRVEAPFVAAEAYGGFEQRGGLPLSTGRYERGGVWRGDRSTQLEGQPDIYPMLVEASAAPAWGAAIESRGPYFAHARLDYRKVWNTGPAVAQAFADSSGQLRTIDQVRVSSERLGVGLDASAGELASVRAGAIYDVHAALVSRLYAAADAYPHRRVSLGAEAERIRPTFDGDSIWNWFTTTPVTTAMARVDVDPLERLGATASFGARVFETDDDPSSPALAPAPAPGPEGRVADPQASRTSRLVDWLGSAYGRFRWERGRASLRAVLETGQRGRREGADLAAERDFKGRQYSLLARASLFDWRDELRPDRSATSFGYVLGGAWRPSGMVEFLVELEHNINRLVGQRYRALAMASFVMGP